MPKARLNEKFSALEHDMISSALASFKQFRPDLEYPESHSDMEAAIRGILIMFDVTRRPLPRDPEEMYEQYPPFAFAEVRWHGEIAYKLVQPFEERTDFITREKLDSIKEMIREQINS